MEVNTLCDYVGIDDYITIYYVAEMKYDLILSFCLYSITWIYYLKDVLFTYNISTVFVPLFAFIPNFHSTGLTSDKGFP